MTGRGGSMSTSRKTRSPTVTVSLNLLASCPCAAHHVEIYILHQMFALMAPIVVGVSDPTVFLPPWQRSATHNRGRRPDVASGSGDANDVILAFYLLNFNKMLSQPFILHLFVARQRSLRLAVSPRLAPGVNHTAGE